MTAATNETVTPLTTTLALSSSLNPATRLQPVTLSIVLSTAAHSAAAVSYSGTVHLYDEAALLATLSLDATGLASYTTASLTAGTHLLSATFDRVLNVFDLAASSSLLQRIVAAASTTNLLITPSPGYQGQNVSLIATVGGLAGVGATGSVPSTMGHITCERSRLAQVGPQYLTQRAWVSALMSSPPPMLEIRTYWHRNRLVSPRPTRPTCLYRLDSTSPSRWKRRISATSAMR